MAEKWNYTAKMTTYVTAIFIIISKKRLKDTNNLQSFGQINNVMSRCHHFQAVEIRPLVQLLAPSMRFPRRVHAAHAESTQSPCRSRHAVPSSAKGATTS